VLKGDLKLSDFLREMSDYAKANHEFINALINQELGHGNYEGLQILILIALKSPSNVYTEILCRILDVASPEMNNDDVVDLLDDLSDPRSIHSLVKAAKREWEGDEYKHINKKCVWALKRIGTTEAENGLRELSKSSSKEVEAWALQELNSNNIKQGSN